MATMTYVGNVTAVAQVDTVTIGGSPSSADTYTVTINGKSITYTFVTADTTTTVATGLTALLNASTVPAEFKTMTWTSNAAVITATANASGITLAITVSTSGGTITHAVVTAATGPADLDNAANYSGGSLPTTGDTLILDGNSPNITANLSALSAVTLAVLNATQYSGTVGLPPVNPAGYSEYLAQYLTLGATSTLIGNNGSGPALFKLATGTVACALQVRGGTVQFKGTSSSNTLDVAAGSVTTAPYGVDAANLSTAFVSNNGSLTCPSWVVPGSVTQSGGTVVLGGGCSTLFAGSGGQATIVGSQALATLSLTNMTLAYNSSGTITTANLYQAGIIDKSGDDSALTITTANLYGQGAGINDPSHAVTIGTLNLLGGSRGFQAN